MQSEHIKTEHVDGTDVEIYGIYDENTPEGEYEWYDLFVGENCINEGDPLYTLMHTPQDIRWHLNRSNY
jgi:hypothetical protein